MIPHPQVPRLSSLRFLATPTGHRELTQEPAEGFPFLGSRVVSPGSGPGLGPLPRFRVGSPCLGSGLVLLDHQVQGWVPLLGSRVRCPCWGPGLGLLAWVQGWVLLVFSKPQLKS